ncbi:MurR/RpiR family transcriptional regulator [Amaricoccus solimangrovi]|uniref:MurR/RpiR family transcriptional regulator n=1 Tax=Amaricoccus solimangrovi TaxID=2589815 RepID=A0A501WW40_9RHOB|nr:MurR/RpiR family transcriptional regulator [Amaricoccus solimangrovi]TPE51617.1 MurR/RpiR family transcriptional regulator [Amaricoccus solimangrovi]
MNEPENFRGILDRMAQLRPTLSPQLQKICGHVLNQPGSVATLSMRKVAAEAGVPPPTLPRLAQAAGFDTYEAFRDVFRAHFQSQAQWYPELAEDLQREGSARGAAHLTESFRRESLANIDRLFRDLDATLLSEVADRLSRARMVYVAGMQGSFALAMYGHYIAGMAFPNWRLLEARPNQMSDLAVDMGPSDVLLAISTPPCARMTIVLADAARARGAHVIGLTNTRLSPLAERSDTIVLASTESPQYFDSIVATALALEVIVGLLVARGGPEVVANIERIETFRKNFGEYWDEN